MTEVKRLGNIYGEDRGTGFAGNVWDKEGVSPTITTMQGGGREPMIVEDVLEPINTEDDGTCRTIKAQYYKNSTANYIRKDSFGATAVVCAGRIVGRNPDKPTDRTCGIPTEQMLELNDDTSICNTLTTVGKDNVILEADSVDEPKCMAVRYRHYKHKENGEDENPPHCEMADDGVTNTITSVQKDNLVLEPRCLGGIGEKWGDKQYKQGNRVYDSECVATALTAQPVGGLGGNTPLYLINEDDESNGEKDFAVIDAYNKREIDNDVCGCLTANGNVSSTHAGTFLIKEDDTASNSESINYVESRYRIRKLTEKETWRLMGFTDEDFNKARAVNSATQCYKQAGNSIVKQVLMAIFLQMGIQGKPRWNDMSVEERQKLVEGSLDFLEK